MNIEIDKKEAEKIIHAEICERFKLTPDQWICGIWPSPEGEITVQVFPVEDEGPFDK
jgi:hypothetical protein